MYRFDPMAARAESRRRSAQKLVAYVALAPVLVLVLGALAVWGEVREAWFDLRHPDFNPWGK